jgi:hypothetical protein
MPTPSRAQRRRDTEHRRTHDIDVVWRVPRSRSWHPVELAHFRARQLRSGTRPLRPAKRKPLLCRNSDLVPVRSGRLVSDDRDACFRAERPEERSVALTLAHRGARPERRACCSRSAALGAPRQRHRRQPDLHKLAAMAAGVSEAVRERGVAVPGASILGRLRFAQRGKRVRRVGRKRPGKG